MNWKEIGSNSYHPRPTWSALKVEPRGHCELHEWFKAIKLAPAILLIPPTPPTTVHSLSSFEINSRSQRHLHSLFLWHARSPSLFGAFRSYGLLTFAGNQHVALKLRQARLGRNAPKHWFCNAMQAARSDNIFAIVIVNMWTCRYFCRIDEGIFCLSWLALTTHWHTISVIVCDWIQVDENYIEFWWSRKAHSDIHTACFSHIRDPRMLSAAYCLNANTTERVAVPLH